jgi:toxin ParE1/3/4
VNDVVVSPAARADLQEIRDYSLGQFSTEIADAYFLGFDDAFDLLARHPQAGPEKSDLGRGIRCLVHRRHRIFYRCEPNRVIIVRIIHHARNARQQLIP